MTLQFATPQGPEGEYGGSLVIQGSSFCTQYEIPISFVLTSEAQTSIEATAAWTDGVLEGGTTCLTAGSSTGFFDAPLPGLCNEFYDGDSSLMVQWSSIPVNSTLSVHRAFCGGVFRTVHLSVLHQRNTRILRRRISSDRPARDRRLELQLHFPFRSPSAYRTLSPLQMRYGLMRSMETPYAPLGSSPKPNSTLLSTLRSVPPFSGHRTITRA